VSVLVVQHEVGCTLAWFADSLPVELDVRHPYRGDELPADLGGHDALIVLGGSMGAYDDAAYPWLPATRALLSEGVAGEKPTLGICLGHQLLAVACGGVVEKAADGPSIGVVTIEPTPASADDPLLGALTYPARSARWNADVVTTLPAGAVPVATDATGRVQAARFGPSAWGLQFHPEAGAAVFATWAAEVRATPDGPAIEPRIAAGLAQVSAAEDDLATTGRRLADAFAAAI
jgi:GMP synthase (glutamine-hydrolysing)